MKRSDCRLLELCWNQNWKAAFLRLLEHPEEAFCRAENSKRTALHLATIPSVTADNELLEELLKINPHAVTVEDRHKYGGTPLHFACGNPSVLGNLNMIRSFVAAAKNHTSEENRPRCHSYSPLLLAARKAAHAETLRVLVHSGLDWIVPWTGGEIYLEVIACRPNDSPLEALWKIADPTYFVKQEGDEEEMQLVASSALLQKMRRIAEANKASWTNTDKDPAIQAWIKCLALLVGSKSCEGMNFVHRTSCLYHPIPSLVHLMCHLFPEQVLQATDGRLPLYDALRHDKGGRQDESIRCLFTTQPSSLLFFETESGLYPAMFAATLNRHSLSLVYDMLRLCPQVVKLQLGGTAGQPTSLEDES